MNLDDGDSLMLLGVELTALAAFTSSYWGDMFGVASFGAAVLGALLVAYGFATG